MRTLLLMRGAPASGKSQWIRDNSEAYNPLKPIIPYAFT